eukprot:CAMPEP_0179200476 /NCGR_PEP_ID=MMETSP0796-20121207/99771_1 /TAXON_ID=73915 /ORGANISM="Pyrodinium bahamense, Strain pbaha01" /LENGTH=358 /DNA_ID=CAMNT_0020905031 /DNA_START=65 /DNA_END=1141 /DNA_ORIENTATION=+
MADGENPGSIPRCAPPLEAGRTVEGPAGRASGLDEQAARRVDEQAARRNFRDLLGEPERLYVCPITHELFREPVVALDGHTYERRAIEKYFRTSAGSGLRSPMTNAPLASAETVPNQFCRMVVQRYKEEVVRDIAKAFPLAMELGDLETAEALVLRALEYEREAQDVKRMHLQLLQRQVAKADLAKDLPTLAGKLSRLAARDCALADAAVVALRHTNLQELVARLPQDGPAAVVVTYCLLRRQAAWAMKAFGVPPSGAEDWAGKEESAADACRVGVPSRRQCRRTAAALRHAYELLLGEEEEGEAEEEEASGLAPLDVEAEGTEESVADRERTEDEELSVADARQVSEGNEYGFHAEV